MYRNKNYIMQNQKINFASKVKTYIISFIRYKKGDYIYNSGLGKIWPFSVTFEI